MGRVLQIDALVYTTELRREGFITLLSWLIFALVASHCLVIVRWYTSYFSVLRWTPISALLYYIVTDTSLSAEAMAALGRPTDCFSLYSTVILTTRMNYTFAVYSCLQLLVGVTLTISVLWMVGPARLLTQVLNVHDSFWTVFNGKCL